ncbi:MAG TPA: hypothetical protein VF022_09630 [Rhodanobacteraceae bacterium]
MNKPILALAITVALGFGGVAAAQVPADASATATTQHAPDARQVPAPGARDCVRETGSHIKRHDQACLPVNGRSYSRDDLDRTGNPNIGRALQQLDPNVQITGH